MPSNRNGGRLAVLGVLLGAALLLPAAADAQTIPNPDDPGWRFSLTPNLWLPSIDGELRYGPRQRGAADVRVDPAHIVDTLN